MYIYICMYISYNTARKDLPDIYARCLRHTAPEDECIYIWRIPKCCVITNILHFYTAPIRLTDPKWKKGCMHLITK